MSSSDRRPEPTVIPPGIIVHRTAQGLVGPEDLAALQAAATGGEVRGESGVLPAVHEERPFFEAAVDVVGIGASTGGPKAIERVLAELPAGLACPVLVAQHMPPTFTAILADSLNAKSRLRVHELDPNRPSRLRAGDVVVARGGWHMQIRAERDGLFAVAKHDPPEHSCRPAVDPLFRSMAQVVGKRSVAVVLTGMGRDGTAGCAAIRRRGGHVIVQDEGSSTIWGMPGSVVEEDGADEVVPIGGIADAIVRRLRRVES